MNQSNFFAKFFRFIQIYILIFAQKKFFSCLLLAAGQGKRFTSNENEIPKQFLEIQENYTIIEMSFDAVAPFANTIVLPLSVSYFEEYACILERLLALASKHGSKLIFCEGGVTRQLSVENTLQKVDSEYVFVHDSARPLVAKSDIETLLETVLKTQAAILAVPVSDTIKQVSPFTKTKRNNYPRIEKTIDRNYLWAAQTPQAFQTSLFQKAIQFAKETNFTGTDDASIVEHSGADVSIVQTQKPNPKVTYKQDLKYVEFLLNAI